MNLRLLGLLFGLTLLLVMPCQAAQQEEAVQGVVTWVYDGDTLAIEPFGKVRLLGIDCPEREDSPRDKFLIDMGVSAARQRQIYRAAKQFNISFVKGKQVELTLGQPQRDRHDRLLAYVTLPEGRLLNRILLEQGLAVVYRRFSFSKKEDFLLAESQARTSGLGLWAKQGE